MEVGTFVRVIGPENMLSIIQKGSMGQVGIIQGEIATRLGPYYRVLLSNGEELSYLSSEIEEIDEQSEHSED